MYEIYWPEKIADILATIPLVSPPNDINYLPRKPVMSAVLSGYEIR